MDYHHAYLLLLSWIYSSCAALRCSLSSAAGHTFSLLLVGFSVKENNIVKNTKTNRISFSCFACNRLTKSVANLRLFRRLQLADRTTTTVPQKQFKVLQGLSSTAAGFSQNAAAAAPRRKSTQGTRRKSTATGSTARSRKKAKVEGPKRGVKSEPGSKARKNGGDAL